MNLILASSSSVRKRILKSARIEFTSHTPNIDEEVVKEALISDGASARDIADTLAEMKARKTSQKHRSDIVLGCDQILSFSTEIRGKPNTKEDVAAWFKEMAGKQHMLFTANVLYQNGLPIWRHIGEVKLKFRDLSELQIKEYVQENWDEIKNCAGGYRFEETPHLFESVEGTYFDILGLSIGPIIAQMKRLGSLDQAHPNPKLAAVLGHPIKHSKSPILHNFWLDEYGIPGEYLKIDVPPDFFLETARLLLTVGFEGFNVTIPHKKTAIELANVKTEITKRVGASNTIYRNDEGQIVADNTDGLGFMNNLKSSVPHWSAKDKRILVLGAGGASASIIDAFLSEGASNVILTNRTRDTAEELAKLFGNRVIVVDWDDRNQEVNGSDVIVNATSLGMVGQHKLELDIDKISQDTVVYDLVYNPLETELLKAAKENGAQIVDGIGMLLHQAAPGFEKWFGKTPSVTEKLKQAVLK